MELFSIKIRCTFQLVSTLYIKMNGMPECELRFRNTVLVTLDTGSGTKKTLS